MIQNQNDYIHYLDSLEAQLNRLENIENVKIEETQPNTFLTIFDSPSSTNETEESWCLGDLDQNSISSHQYELDQSQPMDKLASFNLNEIELDCECKPDPRLCHLIPNFEYILTPVSLPNLDPIPGPTLIPVPVYYEIGSLILDSHIHLMDHKYELKFFDLELTLETHPTLELKFDFPEPVLVPNPIIFKPKSITSSTQILLLVQGVDNDDSAIVFQDWSYNQDSCNVRFISDPIQLGANNIIHQKEVLKGGFLDDLQD